MYMYMYDQFVINASHATLSTPALVGVLLVMVPSQGYGAAQWPSANGRRATGGNTRPWLAIVAITMGTVALRNAGHGAGVLQPTVGKDVHSLQTSDDLVNVIRAKKWQGSPSTVERGVTVRHDVESRQASRVQMADASKAPHRKEAEELAEESISDFVGRYGDSKHPGCWRKIQDAGDGHVSLTGVDGGVAGTEACDGLSDSAWPGPLPGEVHGTAITVDLRSRGVGRLKGKLQLQDGEPTSILWADGNTWPRTGGAENVTLPNVTSVWPVAMPIEWKRNLQLHGSGFLSLQSQFSESQNASTASYHLSSDAVIAPNASSADWYCAFQDNQHGAGQWSNEPRFRHPFYSKVHIVNDTLATCLAPWEGGSDPIFVEGFGQVALTQDGIVFSTVAHQIQFYHAVDVVIGRRPYVSEEKAKILLRTDHRLLSKKRLTVTAELPSGCSCHRGHRPCKWRWQHVQGGKDVALDFALGDLDDPMVHNDLSISVTWQGHHRETHEVVRSRRFMKLPPPHHGVEVVQVDYEREGLLVDSRPFIGSGFYYNRLYSSKPVFPNGGFDNEDAAFVSEVPDSIDEYYESVEDLLYEIKDLARRGSNLGLVYGAAKLPPVNLKQLLDGAHEMGVKIIFDVFAYADPADGTQPNADGLEIPVRSTLMTGYNVTTHATNVVAGIRSRHPHWLPWLTGVIKSVKNHAALWGYNICDDCCVTPERDSGLSQIYTLIKDMDPYHVIVGGVQCVNNHVFSDYPSLLPPTEGVQDGPWMSSGGQPALQLGLDVPFSENYYPEIAAHRYVSQHPDGAFRRGMFRAPIVNLPGIYNLGHQFPLGQGSTESESMVTLRSVLWMGLVTAGMRDQVTFIENPTMPWAQVDQTVLWSAEVKELLPSLAAKFGGLRDRTAIVFAPPSGALAELDGVGQGGLQLASVRELRGRVWREHASCAHAVVVNTNGTHAALYRASLTGEASWAVGMEAMHLFDSIANITIAHGVDTALDSGSGASDTGEQLAPAMLAAEGEGGVARAEMAEALEGLVGGTTETADVVDALDRFIGAHDAAAMANGEAEAEVGALVGEVVAPWFDDWIGPGQTNVYRIGDGCSATDDWSDAVARGDERPPAAAADEDDQL